ncbi:MAG: hypothetical protein V7644_1682 [Actinomycetota bacterium]|jgi:hypothetical protein
MEPAIAFRVREHDEPACEIRVNFGVFAGRSATPAEIEDLATELRDTVASFTIVSEDRHEFGPSVEATLHQVVIEIAREYAGERPEQTCAQLVGAADQWAQACIAARSVDVAEF